MAKSNSASFWPSRQGKAIVGVVILGLAYAMFVRATDTGSLQQYAMLIVLIVFGGERLFKAALNK